MNQTILVTLGIDGDLQNVERLRSQVLEAVERFRQEGCLSHDTDEDAEVRWVEAKILDTAAVEALFTEVEDECLEVVSGDCELGKDMSDSWTRHEWDAMSTLLEHAASQLGKVRQLLGLKTND